jgi:hypothetical protein
MERRNEMRRAIAILGALVLVLTAASASHAVLLSDLLNGGSVTAGDKMFDSWTLGYYDSSDPTRSFNAANIDVTALTDGGLNPGPGLDFAASNGELRVIGNGIYDYIDLMFAFRVSILDPTMRITDNTLEVGMASLFHPAGADVGIYIRETVGTAPGLSDLADKNVEFSYLDPGPVNWSLTASATIAPQSEIWVTKNILIWASSIYGVSAGETADLGSFSQRFSQTPVGVPEPGMLALLALGGIALLRFKRS